MEKQPLFEGKGEKYTEKAHAISREFLEFLSPFFDKHAKNHPIRELENLLHMDVTGVALDELLGL